MDAAQLKQLLDAVPLLALIVSGAGVLASVLIAAVNAYNQRVIEGIKIAGQRQIAREAAVREDRRRETQTIRDVMYERYSRAFNLWVALTKGLELQSEELQQQLRELVGLARNLTEFSHEGVEDRVYRSALEQVGSASQRFNDALFAYEEAAASDRESVLASLREALDDFRGAVVALNVATTHYIYGPVDPAD